MPKCVSIAQCWRMEWFPVRVGLAIITMLGLFNVFMVRVNLSVAIVAMVRHNTTANTTLPPYCRPHHSIPAGQVLVTTAMEQSAGNETTTVSPALLVDPEIWGMEEEVYQKEEEEEQALNWNEWVQGLVLGSFFYGYWMSQVGGGRLAEMYGTKLVMGVTVFSGGLAALLTPIAAHTHYLALVILRALQGFMQGAAIPCIFPMMVQWIPHFEQSKFVAYVLFCNNISITFTMVLCGVVIDTFGWEGAFYVTGASSLAWCVVWYIFMYDSPENHPRITQKELNYILQSKEVCPNCNGDMGFKSSSSSVPWLSVARSLPVWALVVCEAGNSFGYSLYFSYLPTYIEQVIGVSVSKNGLLSSLPFLARYLGGVLFATLGECLIIRRKMSAVAVRRTFSAVAMLGPAANLIAVAYSGCDTSLAIFLLCFGFFLNGAIAVGVFANKAEVSLRYAGTVSGIGNTAANVQSFVVPFIVATLTRNQQTIGAWQKVFWTCVPVYVVCEVFFLVFVSASRQHWDLTDRKPKLTQDQDQDTHNAKEMDEDGDKVKSCQVCDVLPQVT